MDRLLGDWYGKERGAVELSRHTDQPTPLGELVEQISATLIPPETGLFNQLQSRWSELGGKIFARFTEPLSLRDGVLHLGVRHSALIQELAPSLGALRAHLNSALKKDFCREIRLELR